MAETVAVVLGDTLLLSSIALELSRHEGYRVLSIDPSDRSAERICKSLAPRIVVGELYTSMPFLLRIQSRDSETIFLVIDEPSDRAILISGQEMQASSLCELVAEVCLRALPEKGKSGG